MRQMTLVKITNPNPKPLLVWRGSTLLDSVLPRHSLLVAMGSDLLVSSEMAKALAVFVVDGDDVTAEEWIQKVGHTPSHVNPEDAYDPKAERDA